MRLVLFLCLVSAVRSIRFDKEPYKVTPTQRTLPALFFFNARGTIYSNTFALVQHRILAFFLSELEVIEDGALCVPSVYHLHITFTYIRNLTKHSIGHCPSLYYLTIKGSRVGLDPDALSGLANLKVLDINGLKTEHVTRRMFANLTELRTLSFVDSEIAEIDADAFDDLVNLKTLDLKMNSLDEIGDCFLSLNQLFSLDLSYNRLVNFSWEILRNLQNLKVLSVPEKVIRLELVQLLPKYCPKLIILYVHTIYCVNLDEFYRILSNETNISMLCRRRRY